MKYSIPLSYNPINSKGLEEVLRRYEDQHHNQMISAFEEEFKKVTGTSNAVALNSGTSAIHLALKVLGVGPGDYVIAPTFTYIATINPILYLGGQPVFVDSESETWNMDPTLLQKAIQNLLAKKLKPKAIIVVHTYGMPSNMKAIMKLASEYGIQVIEDAAESIGSFYEGKNVGLMGDVGVYSFNNNKVITTYGGGVFVSKDKEIAERVRFLATQARENLPYYEHKEVGYNYIMSPLNAAYGLSQLPHLKDSIRNRRLVFQRYKESLKGTDTQFQTENEGSTSNRWFSTILFQDEATRLAISSVLHTAGIETRPLWNPMHQQPVYQQFENYLNDISDRLYKCGLCLPSSSWMLPGQQQKVIDLLLKTLQ